jgi:hypothetical protein
MKCKNKNQGKKVDTNKEDTYYKIYNVTDNSVNNIALTRTTTPNEASFTTSLNFTGDLLYL